MKIIFTNLKDIAFLCVMQFALPNVPQKFLEKTVHNNSKKYVVKSANRWQEQKTEVFIVAVTLKVFISLGIQLFGPRREEILNYDQSVIVYVNMSWSSGDEFAKWCSAAFVFRIEKVLISLGWEWRSKKYDATSKGHERRLEQQFWYECTHRLVAKCFWTQMGNQIFVHGGVRHQRG